MECRYSGTVGLGRPTNPVHVGVTLHHLALIKCQGTGIRQGGRWAHVILQPCLMSSPMRASLLSSSLKPYLAYYDNFKNFSDYSLENPICFLCKEETILSSVWEVGTFHLS